MRKMCVQLCEWKKQLLLIDDIDVTDYSDNSNPLTAKTDDSRHTETRVNRPEIKGPNTVLVENLDVLNIDPTFKENVDSAVGFIVDLSYPIQCQTHGYPHQMEKCTSSTNNTKVSAIQFFDVYEPNSRFLFIFFSNLFQT